MPPSDFPSHAPLTRKKKIKETPDQEMERKETGRRRSHADRQTDRQRESRFTGRPPLPFLFFSLSDQLARLQVLFTIGEREQNHASMRPACLPASALLFSIHIVTHPCLFTPKNAPPTFTLKQCERQGSTILPVRRRGLVSPPTLAQPRSALTPVSPLFLLLQALPLPPHSEMREKRSEGGFHLCLSGFLRNTSLEFPLFQCFLSSSGKFLSVDVHGEVVVDRGYHRRHELQKDKQREVVPWFCALFYPLINHFLHHLAVFAGMNRGCGDTRTRMGVHGDRLGRVLREDVLEDVLRLQRPTALIIPEEPKPRSHVVFVVCDC
mmetsp:Transcript_13956/g.27896  ORF Transcript_13956/g.27896 Transcript_13956/m.27896 type:complete len:322 (+) Transcript_13956:330-1295(+)